MGCGSSTAYTITLTEAPSEDGSDAKESPSVPATPAVTPVTPATEQPVVLGWLLETSPETWEALPEDVNDTLIEACSGGEAVALYTVRGARPSEDVSYDVDFRRLLRTERRTGLQQRLRWGPVVGRAPKQRSAEGRTQYQWELKNGSWADFEEEELQHLIRAWMMGHDEVSYEARGLQYQINFRRMVQINISSGQTRHIRVKPRQTEPSPVDTAPPAATATAAAAPAAAPRHDTAQGTGARQGSAPGKRFSLGKGSKEGSSKDPPGAQSGGGAGEAKPAEQRLPESPLPVLPEGVAWPKAAAAQTAAQALYLELLSSRQGMTQSERRSLYKQKCFSWHPDKNLDQEDVATEVFQFLQLLREWLLA